MVGGSLILMPVRMGVLRVLTLPDPEDVALHGRIIEEHFPGVETTSRCIPDHPEGIPDLETEAEAIPYVERLAREMAPEVDVLTISCALDPAVGSLDAELDIPVVGAGASVAAVAMAHGRQVGTLGLESGVPPGVRNLLGDHFEASEIVEGADTTNALTTDRGRRAIGAAIDRLEERGCDVVAPCCTGITTSGVLSDARERASIPIVDPVRSMGSTAFAAVAPRIFEDE